MRPARVPRTALARTATLVLFVSVCSVSSVYSVARVSAASVAPAQSVAPALPSFTVAATDGASVESRALAVEGTWLLVYVQPRCAPCDALLTRLDSDERPSASRIVIVGGGMDGEGVKALSEKYPNLKTSRWLADPERRTADAMAIQANPTAFGMRASSIAWRLAGTVQNPRELDSILFTWLEKR